MLASGANLARSHRNSASWGASKHLFTGMRFYHTAAMDNVILVTVDSLRADHVGYHGYNRDTTPNLDRRAEENHVFYHAFANGCNTRRSFPSILSGTYPLMYGGFEKLSRDRTVLAEPFQDAGFTTGGFQSNPFLLAQFGYGRGFEKYYGSNSEASSTSRIRQYFKNTLDHGPVLHALQRAFNLSERFIGYNPGEPFVKADEITDEALSWVSGVDSPVFLWVHFMDVHHPYHPPVAYQREFRDEPVSKRRAVKLRRKMLDSPQRITEVELQTILDLYDGEIRFVDEEINRLIEDARAELSGDTIVAVTSDHGDELDDHHGFAHHDTFYDELLHVPLIVDAPGSGEYHDLVGLIDLAPTLLSYGEVEIPDSYVGESLRTLVSDGEWSKQYVFAESGSTADGEFQCGCRTADLKYIRGGDHPDAADKPSEELYDLEADPGETSNLIDDAEQRAAVLREVVDEHEREVRATDRSVEPVEIDSETQRRLEDLGYT